MKFDNLSLGDSFAEKLVENLPKTADLEVFELSNNRLTGRGATALFSIIKNNSKKLDISYNPGIDDTCYKYLAKNILGDYRYFFLFCE